MAELIPIFGMIAGVLITGSLIFGAVRIMQGPVGMAWARKIQGPAGAEDEEVRSEVARLRDQVEDMQRQLGETQERLDFTERILAQRTQAHLPGD